MNESDTSAGRATTRVFAVLLVLALSLANSALFYFVIWDMFALGQPYTVILFFISGGAHLIYFFMPWFLTEMLAPIFRSPDMKNSRYKSDSASKSSSTENSTFFINLCTQFGLALCAAAIGLWLLQADFFPEVKVPELALITKANCLQIGGQPETIDGKLVCLIKEKDIRGGTITTSSRKENRI